MNLIVGCQTLDDKVICYNIRMNEILVVDDERTIRAGLKRVLTEAGFSVRMARDGKSTLAALDEKRPDLVLLDVMMPGEDGFTVCERIRLDDRELPVVFLTAKDAESDLVRGLAVGADDFVSKSESDAVLLARIRKTLERAGRLNGTDAPDNLTKTEADIYRYLLDNLGEWMSYREIFDAIRGAGYYGDEGAIRSHISRLRGKLPKAYAIESKRGRGFALLLK